MKLAIYMKKNDYYEDIKRSPLFEVMNESALEALRGESLLMQYSSGEEISAEGAGHITLILKGRANVFSADGERETLLRILGEGDVFGVAALFTGTGEISRVIAGTKISLLRIPRSSILRALQNDGEFLKRYISFLENRIIFLNKRISAFTAGSAERRIATFLSSVSHEESFEIRGIPFSTLAKQLDMGRASFYRALEILSEDGSITHGPKLITVISRTDLIKKHITSEDTKK